MSGWMGLKQPKLVHGIPAYGSNVGTRWSLKFPPTQAFSRAYEITIRRLEQGICILMEIVGLSQCSAFF